MLILTHPNTNAHHGKPKDWDDERDGICQTLPTVSVPGLHASFWQPEPEELDVLLRGGSIELRIAATYHPVVSVGVEEWPRQRHDSDGHPIITGKRCAICSGKHDNDALTDICTTCETRINEEGAP